MKLKTKQKNREKSVKQKAGSVGTKTILINLQPDSSRKKENIQINKIRNEKGEITTDSTEIQIII